MKINQLLTPYNYNKGDISRIKYIVIHYVGATGTAKANCEYYASANVGASAHYYVDFNGDIWQSVEDKNIAWHCGAKTYTHPECRNANAIGIELCVRNKGNKNADSKDWYFEEATVNASIRLTKELMAKYHIDIDHVIRHYDVTGKYCPNPFVINHTKHTWDGFKKAITSDKQGWEQDAKGWKFYIDNNAIHDAWYKDAEEWYWFGSDGYMFANAWLLYNGDWYWLEESGKMAKDCFVVIDGKLFHFDNNGAMTTKPINLCSTDYGDYVIA